MNVEKQWPVKILLVHPQAPFMQKGSLVIASDCTLLVNPELSNRFKNGETVVVGCPLLEDPDRLAEKIDLIVEETKAKKIEVYTMEVPCCHAIHMMVGRSVEKKQKQGVKVENYIVRVMTGKVEPYTFGRVDRSMVEMEMRAHGGHH
ncbi:MAG: hypothetical protein KIH09_17555 [Candidatus Freyarchaeota archaeon]|nr:hypothetical protein [Candidatus Jordarchaeia archaeon]